KGRQGTRTMARDLRSLRRPSLAFILTITAFFSGSVPEALAQEEPVHLDVRLMGADLVDELVFNWTKTPPFEEAVDLTLAGVDAPIGLDERFAVFVENRLYE